MEFSAGTPARWPSRLQSETLMWDFNEPLFGLEAEQQVKQQHLEKKTNAAAAWRGCGG